MGFRNRWGPLGFGIILLIIFIDRVLVRIKIIKIDMDECNKFKN